MAVKRGMLIVVEGIDGSGKSTQAIMLAEWLSKKGKKVILTREPYTKKLRKLLRNGKKQDWFRLFTQDRKLHLRNVILPALQKGRIVISDRYFYSTLAYQLRPDQWKIYRDKFIKPDIAIIFDLPVSIALKRREKRDSKISQKASYFEKKKTLEKVRKKFLKMKKFPECRITNSSYPPEKIFENVKKIIINIDII
jgi:dTMP kinase